MTLDLARFASSQPSRVTRPSAPTFWYGLGFALAVLAGPNAHAASHAAAATPPAAAAPAAAAPAATAPSAAAPSASCHAQATEKKLAGAAKNSFLSKCEREATERCEAAATERKLAGAARTGNVNKCVKEAVGG